MDTWITPLSIRRTKEDTGKACSHAPYSFGQTASRRARAGASGAVSRRSLYADATQGVSQNFWREEARQVRVAHHAHHRRRKQRGQGSPSVFTEGGQLLLPPPSLLAPHSTGALRICALERPTMGDNIPKYHLYSNPSIVPAAAAGVLYGRNLVL